MKKKTKTIKLKTKPKHGILLILMGHSKLPTKAAKDYVR